MRYFMLSLLVLVCNITTATTVRTSGNTSLDILYSSLSEGDTLIVNQGDTVDVNRNHNSIDLLYIIVDSVMEFDNGKIILSDSESWLYLRTTGVLDTRHNGNPDRLKIGSNIEWSGNEGDQYGTQCFPAGQCVITLPLTIVSSTVVSDKVVITVARECDCYLVSNTTIFDFAHCDRECVLTMTDGLNVIDCDGDRIVYHYQMTTEEPNSILIYDLYGRMLESEPVGTRYIKVYIYEDRIESHIIR